MCTEYTFLSVQKTCIEINGFDTAIFVSLFITSLKAPYVLNYSVMVNNTQITLQAADGLL
jgi:hypothetical protein